MFMTYYMALTIWSSVWSTLRQRAIWHRERKHEWDGIEIYETLERACNTFIGDADTISGHEMLTAKPRTVNDTQMRKCVVQFLRALALAIEKGGM